jgi:hypothetical protein
MIQKHFLHVKLRAGVFKSGLCNVNVADRHG